MTKLEQLCKAIEKHEGWYIFSRSWRNNNPGNLRWSKFQTGQKGGFAYFPDYATGWLALWWDVFCKCSGKTSTGLGPEKTLLDFANVWAPPSDGNDSRNYALNLANATGTTIYTKLETFLDNL